MNNRLIAEGAAFKVPSCVCTDGEGCEKCAPMRCPHGEVGHFWHDGCPACWGCEKRGGCPACTAFKTLMDDNILHFTEALNLKDAESRALAEKAIKLARKKERAEVITEIDKMPRWTFPNDGSATNHEFIDTCVLYKIFQRRMREGRAALGDEGKG